MAKRKMSEAQLANLEKGVKICEETARKYQEKSSAAQRKNTQKRKEAEAFCISANKALAPIQAKSLNDLANKAQDILDDPDSSASEVKLAMEILTFLRDSSGQKPADKQEIKTNQPAVLSEYSEKKIEEVLQRIKNSTYD